MRLAASLVVCGLLVAVVASQTQVPSCARPCKRSSGKVLFWGATPATIGGDTSIVQWLNQNVPAATFDQMDPNAPSTVLSPSLLQSYDLLILCELGRPASDSEAQALADWVYTGGFFFGMSGWQNRQNEVDNTNSYLKYFNDTPAYTCAPTDDCTVSGCTSFYPNQPLLAGIAECDIDFVGGYPSGYAVSYTGSGSFSYLMTTTVNVGQPQHDQVFNLGLVVDLCSASNPRGGRYVLWGDEWISFVIRFNQEAGDEQIWFNIINYLGICTGQCETDADCAALSDCPQLCSPTRACVACNDPSCGAFTYSPECTSATAIGPANHVSLSFNPSVTTCPGN